MTIQKENPGIWIAYCDRCGERHELDTDPDDSLLEAVKEVKEEGWKFRKEIHGWTHTCTDCQQDEASKAMSEAGL